jgi:hypothetical protein
MSTKGDSRYVSASDPMRSDPMRSNARELIGYIYAKIDVARYRYDLLRSETQLEKFTQSTYHLAPNFCGKNCFLVFTKLKSKYYSYLVDRRQLSYTLEKVQFDNLTIQHCNVDIDSGIYNGTIFDGNLIRHYDKWEYIITDTHMLCGVDCTADRLANKLFETQMYLDNVKTQASHCKEKINNNIIVELKVNKLTDIREISQFMEHEIHTYQPNHVRGICFYPDVSGTKLIYMFADAIPRADHVKANQSSALIQSKQSPQPFQQSELKRSERLVKKVYVSRTSDTFYAILEMKATKTADNYKLYALEQVNTDGVVRLKRCQMDIAYISDLNKSRWCREITTDSHRGYVFVKCVWRNDKRKWEPLELRADMKLPSLMDDIRKHLIEMEVTDSESDDE